MTVLPKEFFFVKFSKRPTGQHMRTPEKRGGKYTQLKDAAAQAARIRFLGHDSELWYHHVDKPGWEELDLDKIREEYPTWYLL